MKLIDAAVAVDNSGPLRMLSCNGPHLSVARVLLRSIAFRPTLTSPARSAGALHGVPD